jgi:uncharacterized protein (TIGR03066 family)
MMRVLGLTLTACLVLALSACSGDTGKDKGKDKDGKNGKDGAKKSNAEKIIGRWEVVKSEGPTPPGSTFEFTKDGKMKMTVMIKGKEETVQVSYKVEEDKITVTMKGPDGKENSETATIKTLTDTKLVTEDAKGKVEEFKKK